MQTASSVDMLHGPLTGKLIRFALPIAASSMLQQLFNAADNRRRRGGLLWCKKAAQVNAAGPVVNDHRPCCSILTSTQTKKLSRRIERAFGPAEHEQIRTFFLRRVSRQSVLKTDGLGAIFVVERDQHPVIVQENGIYKKFQSALSAAFSAKYRTF